ncbi:enoyl-CoA hydratase/isomerase family protein, partial [Frankia sp. EI5c]|uniref:enoyl-CoA hydratase/isomerase family protein n=1 Tax=Frankia sp. EI5c TaxID=683316 RepID=UPI001F5B81F5
EAEAIGLADRVVPAGEVYAEALRMAGRFVTGPALALAAAKQAIDDGSELALSEALRLESALFTGLFGTEDRRLGMDSFLERGPGKADFVGR